MSNQMMRRLRVHLTTTMDSVLRTAVFEVMKIFENTLHDHQKEMTLKEEELAQLKLKLQTAELKLKDFQSGYLRRVKMKQTWTAPEIVVDAPGPTSNVSEIEHEVPDDWCAPLGCELVTKDDEDGCPSVRLRAFTIPLCQIPVQTHEVHDNNLQSTSQFRRSRRISALNESGKLPACVQEGQPGPIRNDVKVLPKGKKRENSDQNALDGFGKRKRRVDVTAKEPGNTEESKEDQRKSTGGKSKSPEVEGVETAKKNNFYCKVCKRSFDTELGRNEHKLFHKTCQGCKEVFRYRKMCKMHKLGCDKYILLVKQAPKEEESAPAPCKDVKVNEESILHSPGNVDEGATKKYSCTYCNCKFNLSSKLAKHVSHAHEKPFICNTCPMKFHLRQALGMHMARKHKKPVNSVDVNVDLGWTEPLEGIKGKHSLSPSKDPAKI
ncbi:uncharacterized protein [Leuresthes tenuis]|uniref:uncharacterized protein n=1 Tax=Leuresthes tenuis TaxID=355514 RepID=UPI003B5153A6